MLSIAVHAHTLALILVDRLAASRDAAGRQDADQSRLSSQAGQATAEYALVLLGAASVALLVVAWAARSNRVGSLLDSIFDQLLRRAR